MACGVLPWQWAGCAASVAKSVAGDAFDAIARSFGQAAADAASWLWSQMGQATAVSLGGQGFSTVLGMVAAIAATVGVGLFALQVAQSALRRDPGGLARAVKGLFIAFLAGGAAAAVVNELLAATDALCNGIAQSALGTDQAGLGRLVLGSTVTSGLVGMVGGDGGAAAGVLLLALAILVAVVIVYAALVVRKVLIVLSAVFAPLAFAGSLADVTVAWTRRWVEATLALIFSKVVLVLVFVVGYFMIVQGAGQVGSGVTQDVTQVISGVLVLALAGFAPWVALKVVHFTGDHAHQLHLMATSAVAGPVVAGRMAQKAGPLAQGASSFGQRAASALSSSTGGPDGTGTGEAGEPGPGSPGTGSPAPTGGAPSGAGPAPSGGAAVVPSGPGPAGQANVATGAESTATGSAGAVAAI